MTNINKSVIVPYTTAQMFALISDIQNYHHYLPWCPSSQVLSTNDNITVGRVDIEYLKVKTHFTTRNINIQNEKIEMQLVDGPFKRLHGNWQFTPLGDKGCKITFTLDYQFSSFIIEKVIGAVFEMVIKNIVDAFVKKAHEVYTLKI